MTDKSRQKPVQKKHRWGIAIAVAIIAIAAIMLHYNTQSLHKNTSEGKLRIVSLAPNLTEMLFELDMQDSLVGVSDRCDYPAQAKDIECVGGFGKPNIERLLALQPDLVVATDFENNDVAELLSKSGIEVLELRIGNFGEMFEAFRELGRATGRPRRAEKLVQGMQDQLKAIAERFKATGPLERPKVFVEIWYDPVTTAGQASFVDEVITRAGGVNVAGNLQQGYPCVSGEKVIEWNPDVIVLCYMNQGGYSAAQLAGRIGWADISAVREGRIINNIPPDLILRPGPRLIEGVKILAGYLYGTETENYLADE